MIRISRDLDAACAVVLALLALIVLAVWAAGCAPPLAPLAPLYDQSNALAPRVTAHGQAMTDAARAELRAAIAACPAEEVPRRACAIDAAATVQARHAHDNATQIAIEARHADARAALAAASQCRAQGDETCVTEQRRAAITAMAAIEALLATPAPPETP